MSSATVIPDFDDKIRLVVGNLLAKADNVTKTVLTAFDSSKDISVNKSVLGGSRFNVAALNTCAQFLHIDTDYSNGDHIYTNKHSLANRIILEIISLYPAICADCDKEYSVSFDPVTKPAVRCFLCFQGCHDCASYTPQTVSLFSDSSTSPKGTVWLCKSCHQDNNPIKPKKSKSKSKPASKPVSRQPSGSNTPSQQHVQFSETELQHKLEIVSKQQKSASSSADKSTDKSTRPNLRLDEICKLFKVGKCPHGLSGKTPYNGQSACKMFHPKRCKNFIRNGTHKKFGCKRGNKCMFFHPQHCPSSLSDKSCFSEDCTLVHQVGTKRRKPPDRESSYKRHDSASRNRGTKNTAIPRFSSQKEETYVLPQNEDL